MIPQAIHAAGLTTADLSDNTRPPALCLRRSEFRAQRRARARARLADMAWMAGSVIAGGLLGLLLGAL